MNVSTGTGVSTTTDSSGQYSLDLADGNYTITADSDEYGKLSKDITVAGSDVSGVDFSYGYEMAFTLDDRTNATIFEGEDPRLIVERPDGSLTTTSFNHNQRAFVGMVDMRYYNLTVTSDYPAVWEAKGFLAVEAIPEGPLVMDPSLGWDTNTLATPTEGATPTLDERLDVRFAELESELGGDGTAVTVQSPEPMERVEYTIRDDNGTALYNGSREFEEPTRFYQGQLSDNVTNNASQADDPTLEYSGEYANGSAFNGTTDLSASFGTGGAFGGPTGTSGGSGASTGGVVLLAGGAAIAAYRFRRPLVSAASSAVGRITG
ncbi:carboxypeptidase regulatory-like domain-containing protein [Haloarcula salina]|uniref:carboxypeptidase regulatory-like domain-containing protein n=1 Tax=Haloarcula salina TaxID=1429914 RepID=UPI003C70052F